MPDHADITRPALPRKHELCYADRYRSGNTSAVKYLDHELGTDDLLDYLSDGLHGWQKGMTHCTLCTFEGDEMGSTESALKDQQGSATFFTQRRHSGAGPQLPRVPVMIRRKKWPGRRRTGHGGGCGGIDPLAAARRRSTPRPEWHGAQA